LVFNQAYLGTGTTGQVSQPEAKLLTRFESNALVGPEGKSSVMWRGWKRTVNALVDELMPSRTGGTSWEFRTAGRDINKQVDLGGGEFLPQDINTPAVIVQDISGGFDFSVNPSYIAVFTRINTPSVIVVAETMYYEVREEPCYPIMLDWLNAEGGVDQWLFGGENLINVDHSQGVLVDSPIVLDYQDVRRTKRRFKDATRQRITLRAEQLTFDQLEALSAIKNTESLRCYLSKDGTHWVDVVVVQDYITSAEINSSNHSFAVTIEFPDNYNFYDSKLY
jgi:hypothetical protein